MLFTEGLFETVVDVWITREVGHAKHLCYELLILFGARGRMGYFVTEK
jgi:hypothetical protein